MKSKPDLLDEDASLQIFDDNLGGLLAIPSVPAEFEGHLGKIFFLRAAVIDVKMDGLK